MIRKVPLCCVIGLNTNSNEFVVDFIMRKAEKGLRLKHDWMGCPHLPFIIQALPSVLELHLHFPLSVLGTIFSPQRLRVVK